MEILRIYAPEPPLDDDEMYVSKKIRAFGSFSKCSPLHISSIPARSSPSSG